MNQQSLLLPTATQRAIAQIQTDGERMRELVEATTLRFEIPCGLAKSLRMPAVKLPSGLAESIAATKRISDTMLNVVTC